MIEAADDADLPFAAESFDLVVSRHPTEVRWGEIARVLRPGGTYLLPAGRGGLQPRADRVHDGAAAGPAGQQQRALGRPAQAERAGLAVVDLREEALRTVFNDIAAVVYFLRKVLWTVPGFTVEGYRDRLRLLHGKIQAEGPFVAHAQRFLIEARQP